LGPRSISLLSKESQLPFPKNVTLSNLAQLRGDENLYRESFEKYEKAATFNSKTVYTVYYNWGNALYAFADFKKDESVFRECFEKFKKATIINPKNSTAFYNWGYALSTLAQLKGDEGLFRKSIEKFKLSLAIAPDFCDPLVGWGHALAGIGKLTDDVNMYEQSIRKYKKAMSLHLDDENGSIAHNWGFSLYYMAKLKNYDVSILKEALEKFQLVYKVNKKAYSLACIYALLRDKENALKYLKETMENKDVTPDFVLADTDWKEYLSDKEFIELVMNYKLLNY
jgi:tetratricopeptide (TPR) repeat protein